MPPFRAWVSSRNELGVGRSGQRRGVGGGGAYEAWSESIG